MFNPGDMVVCVAADWSSCSPYWLSNTPNRPVLNGVYHVRNETIAYDGIVGLHLEEIRNPVTLWTEGRGEPSFNACCFRKIDTPNISELVEAMNKAPTELVE